MVTGNAVEWENGRRVRVRRWRWLAAALAVFLLGGLPTAPPALASSAAPGAAATTSIERISYHADGRQVLGDSHALDLTANGRFALYTIHSEAWSLDTMTGARVRHDVTTSGTVTSSGVLDGSISDDGRFVVFATSVALEAADTNGTYDVYLRDRDVDGDGALDEPGEVLTELVSRGPDGSVGNSISWSAEMSEDGRFVTFQGRSSNWSTSGWPLFIRDRQAATTTQITGGSLSPSHALSGDGRFVAYVSSPGVEGVSWPHNEREVILLDRDTSTRQVVGRTPSDFAMGLDPTISRDGRYVGFASFSNALLAGDTNSAQDGFVWDRTTGIVETVNRTADGAWGSGETSPPVFSSDGRYVVFDGMDGNLVAGDSNGVEDGFARDMVSAETRRVTLTHDDAQANNQALAVAVSDDGQLVLIDAYASNLVLDDTNNRPDAFLRRGVGYQVAPPTRTVTVTTSGGGTGIVTSDPDGIACPSSCAASYEDGSTIVLTASPSADSTFEGFSGACTGSTSCTLTLSDDIVVDAAFAALPPPAPPDAVDDDYSTAAGTTLSVAAPGVLGNDADPEGGPLAASVLAPPTHGSVAMAEDGSFTYTPEAGFSGTDQLTYQITDQQLLTDAAVVTIDVISAPASDLIVWSSLNGGLWVGGPGSEPTQVLTGAAWWPSWSPDRSRIAFASDRDGTWDLWVVNVDGSGLAKVTDDAAFDEHPAWSPDGTRIAWATTRDGDFEIWTIGVDGGLPQQLTANTSFDSAPAWSPRGDRLVFAGGSDIRVMDADGTDSRTVVADSSSIEADPSWSPDGTQIAFGSFPLFGGDASIQVVDADGTGRHVIATGGPSFDPTWSPDGAHLAFGSNRSGDGDVWVSEADGSDVVNLSNRAGTDQAPDWGRRASADLEANVSARTAISPSEDPELAVTVMNRGTAVATDTRAILTTTGPISTSVTHPDCASEPVSEGERFVCDLGDVAPGATVDIPSSAEMTAAGTATVTLAVSTSADDTIASNDTDTVAIEAGSAASLTGTIAYSSAGGRFGHQQVTKLFGVTPGGLPSRLTTTPSSVEENGSLSPDATTVALSTQDRATGLLEVGLYAVGASEPHTVFEDVRAASGAGWSRDGATLALAAHLKDNQRGLYLVPMDGSPPRFIRITDLLPFDGRPVFSNAGDRVAMTTCRFEQDLVCRIVVFDLETESRTTVVDGFVDERVRIQWSMDDSELLFATPAGGGAATEIKAVSAGGGSPRGTGLSTDLDFVLAPDGGHVAVTENGDALRLVPMAGGDTLTVFDHDDRSYVGAVSWSPGHLRLRTFVVTGGGDDDPLDDGCNPAPGDCTLAEAIEDNNEIADPAIDTTIVVHPGTVITGTLPVITRPVKLIGDVSPTEGVGGTGVGADPAQAECGTHFTRLEGNDAGPGAVGLRIAVGRDAIRPTLVRGFRITGFSSDGVRVRDSSKVRFRCVSSGWLTSSGSNRTNSNGGDGFDIADSNDVVLFPSVSAQMNASDGAEVTGRSRGIRMLGSSLSDSGGLGIDLGRDGIDPTDVGDADLGANGLVNRPTILNTGVATDPFRDRAFFRVAHAPVDRPFRVDVYLNAWCDRSGSGEAMQWMGAGIFGNGLTGPGRIVSIDLPFDVPLYLLTASVTTEEGTSELSGCLHRDANFDPDADTSTAVGPTTTITAPTNPGDGTGDRPGDPTGTGGGTSGGGEGDEGGDDDGDSDEGGTPGGDRPDPDSFPDPEGYVVVGQEGEITIDEPGVLDGVSGDPPLQALREPGGDIPQGAWRLASNGVVTLDARSLQAGSYSGRYSVVDRDGDRSPAVAILFLVLDADGNIPDTVTDPPPSAEPRPDRYTLEPGVVATRSGTASVLANDWPASDTGLTSDLVNAGALGGRLTLRSDGAVTVDTRSLAEGTYTSTYRLRANGADRGTTTITIVVDNGNSCPTAQDDTYDVLVGQRFRVTGALGALGNDRDPDGDPITARLIGTFSQRDISFDSAGTITLDARRASPGTQRGFDYEAVDPDGEVCGRAHVTLRIVPNAPPVANLNFFTVYPGQRFLLPPRGVLGNDFDPDGSDLALTASLVTGVSRWPMAVASAGSVSATVPRNVRIGDVFSATYRVRDALGATANGEIRFRVVRQGDHTIIPTPPIVRDDLHYRVHAGETLIVPGSAGALANDTPASGLFAEGTGEESNGARFQIQRNGGFTVRTQLSDAGATFTQQYYAVHEGYSGVRSTGAATVRVEVVPPRVRCTSSNAGLHLRADDDDGSPTELLTGTVDYTSCWDEQTVTESWVHADNDPFDFDTSTAMAVADAMFFGWKVEGENHIAHASITPQGASDRLDITTRYGVCVDLVEYLTTALSGVKALSKLPVIGGAFKSLTERIGATRLVDDFPKLFAWIDDAIAKAGFLAGRIRDRLEAIPLIGALLSVLGKVPANLSNVLLAPLKSSTINVVWDGAVENISIAEMLDRWASGAVDSLDEFVPTGDEPSSCTLLSSLWDGYDAAEGSTDLRFRADGSADFKEYGTGQAGFMDWFVYWVWLFDLGRNGDPIMTWDRVEPESPQTQYRTCNFTRLRPTDQPEPGDTIDGRAPVPCNDPARRG